MRLAAGLIVLWASVLPARAEPAGDSSIGALLDKVVGDLPRTTHGWQRRMRTPDFREAYREGSSRLGSKPELVAFRSYLDASVPRDFLVGGDKGLLTDVEFFKTFLADGFSALPKAQRLKLLSDLVAVHRSAVSTDVVKEQAMRVIFAGLGPGYVKLAQIISNRTDVIAPSYRGELCKLSDEVPPDPKNKIRGALNAAFGGHADRVIREFDATPLGCGSVAQVHKAVLVSGEAVIVKLIRPSARKRLDANLTTMRRSISAQGQVGKALMPVVEQLQQIVTRETDLRVEADALHEAARNLRGSRRVHVPKVFDELSSREVLVESVARGTKITTAAQGLTDKDRRALADNAFVEVVHQVFGDRFFHADPHPGNVFADAQPSKLAQLTFIDWGLNARIDRGDVTLLAQLALAVVRARPLDAAHTLSKMDAAGSLARKELEAICKRVLSSPDPPTQRLQNLLFEAQSSGFSLRGGVVMAAKALFQAEGTATKIDPSFTATRAVAELLKDHPRTAARLVTDCTRSAAGDLKSALGGKVSAARSSAGSTMSRLGERVSGACRAVPARISQRRTKR
jgi:predicted unusual protein kinase regulating ubiquinone biosynthesis (AarF/ABC1/UbiB family)